MTKKTDLDILDDVYDEAARVEGEQQSRAPSAWSRDTAELYRAKVAEVRRSRLPTATPGTAKPIRPSLLAMTRDALIAKLTELTRAHGNRIQYAHRNLKGLSDDDLRRMLALLEPANDAE